MKTLRIAIIITLLACAAGALHAENGKRTAVLMAVQGTVEIKPAIGEWVPGTAKTALAEGDFIKTGKDSWALININGSTETATVELREKTNMELLTLAADEKAGTASTLLDLYAGEVMVKARAAGKDTSKFEVKTPTSIVAVRGGKTSFSVKVEQMAE